MYILIKIIVFLTLMQVSKPCSIRYYKHVNRKINKNNSMKYPWHVTIRNSEDITTFKLSYGSLIHPRAVLTSALGINGYSADMLIVETKCKDMTRSMNKDNSLGIYGCMSRHVLKIVYPTNFKNLTNLIDSYAILILLKPFYLNSKVSPINLAVNINDVDQNNCVFTRWMREWSITTYRAGIITTPYKASLFNESSSIMRVSRKQFKTDRDWIVGAEFHLLYEKYDELSVIPLNFMGSSLACQLKHNPKQYVQVGMANFQLVVHVINNRTNQLDIERQGSFIGTIHQQCEIMKKVYENICPLVDQKNNVKKKM